jgi:predicted aspartyl protease
VILSKRTICLAAILFASSGANANAGDCHAVRQAILPIAYEGFIPTIPATMNAERVRMGIDTGSSATLLTPETVERFHLKRDFRHTTLSRGVAGTSEVNNVSLDTFGFGGASELMKSVAVISINGPNNNPAIAGLIGADMLSDYDVEFNFPDHRLTLFRIIHCRKVNPPWKGRYMTVPVSISDTHRFLVPVEVNGHPFTAIFDTGASGMRLSRSAALQVGVTEAMLAHDPQAEGFGINEMAFKYSIHQFDQLKIGNEVFHGPHIGVVDMPGDEAVMLIGEDYMRSRRFLLSYSTHTPYIQPVRMKPAGKHRLSEKNPAALAISTGRGD